MKAWNWLYSVIDVDSGAILASGLLWDEATAISNGWRQDGYFTTIQPEIVNTKQKG